MSNYRVTLKSLTWKTVHQGGYSMQGINTDSIKEVTSQRDLKKLNQGA
jgi:hypothetical protein